MASQADTFQNAASSIKVAVEVENPVVVVRYLNADGSEIYSKSLRQNKNLKETGPVQTESMSDRACFFIGKFVFMK